MSNDIYRFLVQHKNPIIIAVAIAAVVSYLLPLESMLGIHVQAQAQQGGSGATHRGPPTSAPPGSHPPTHTGAQGPPINRGHP